MTPPIRFHPELLLAHAAALRSLARSLVADPHAAEDAVQDTMVRAIEHPPVHQERLGAWLRAVLASVVSKRRRGEARRRARERASARPEAAPLAGDPEVLRGVVDAVLALREPYKSAVMMRYFEGLAPREIAARLGVPLATANSRLQRALALLRERLDAGERPGGRSWSQALIAVTGLGRRPVVGLPTPALRWFAAPGVVLVGIKAKVVAGAGALALLGLAFFYSDLLPSDRLAPEPAGVVEAGSHETVLASRPLEQAAQDAPVSERREALAATEAEPPARPEEPAFEYALTVEVRDRNDLPLSGAEVLLGLSGHRMNAAGTTGSDGLVVARWNGRRPSMDVLVGVRHFGQSTSYRPLHLAAGAERRTVLGLEGSLGSGRIQLVFTAVEGSNGVFTLRGSSFSGTPEMIPAGDELKGFTDPLAATSAQHLDFMGSRESFTVGANTILRSRATFDLDFALQGIEQDVLIVEIEPATVEGVVYDSEGAPAPGALVCIGPPDRSTRLHVQTDAEGSYRLEGIGPGTVSLRAGGRDLGVAYRTLDLGPGAVVRWEAFLDRGIELAGRLADRAGAPLAGWWVEVETDDPVRPHFDVAEADAEGRFAIPNLPGGALRVLLYEPGARGLIPSQVIDRVYAGGGERAFEVDTEARRLGSARIVVTDPAGEPAPNAFVRAVHEATGRALHFGAAEDPGSFRLASMPPGRYELEVGSAGRGLVVAAPFDVPPGEEVDLGTFALPAGGRLVLGGAEPAKLSIGIVRERDDVTTFLGRWMQATAEPVLLPEGRYELLVYGPEDAVVSREVFEIAEGVETVVELER